MRARLAGFFGLLYVVAVVSFWIAGVATYLRDFDGLSRFLGFLYVPILALPLIGHGRILGMPAHSPIWWWWFGAQLMIGTAAIWMYPYEPQRLNRVEMARRARGSRALPVGAPRS